MNHMPKPLDFCVTPTLNLTVMYEFSVVTNFIDASKTVL